MSLPENKNPNEPTEEQIRERAYEIHVAGGCEDGHDLSDWLTAERELNESRRGPGARARVTTAGK